MNNGNNGNVYYRSQLEKDTDQALTQSFESGAILPWLVGALVILALIGGIGAWQQNKRRY